MWNDAAIKQLGWYVGNVARSPYVERLEPQLLGQLKVFEGEAVEDDEFSAFMETDDGEKAGSIERREQLRRLRRHLRSCRAAPSLTGEELEQNACFAQLEFDLDAVELEMLLLVLRIERNPELEQFSAKVSNRLRRVSRAIGCLIGASEREVQRRFIPGAKLIECGIFVRSEQSSEVLGDSGYLKVSPALRRIMHRPFGSREEWGAAILGAPLASSLDGLDFEHLGRARDLIKAILGGAAGTGTKGINILLHGPVGTGKTELAKVLANEIGHSLWCVGETDDEGGEPLRGERLAALSLAQRILSSRLGAAILFDEAEDLLTQGFVMRRHNSREGSKVFLNRLLERNPVPVIWTCNGLGDVDQAVLRRMTLIVEMKTPPLAVRERIWRKVFGDAELAIDESAVARLANLYETPPAVAANAARVARLTGGGEADVEETLIGIARVLGLRSREGESNGRTFDPALTNCSEDLASLADKLSRPETPRRWSMCLSGAPGTGKSEFARYIAGRLGMSVMHVRASDLLSKWLGDSEKQIAEAFARARADASMLVLDEADSLLRDRRGATHSWEVTQVNEMLTWMEQHPLPFVCTTNLMEHLDQASLRRFTLKLRFETLTREQAALAFRRFFGFPATRRLPDNLSPGDFETVRRKRSLFGTHDPDRLVVWLEEESAAKGGRPLPIGFMSSARQG
jgi:transitional endoplasmic reticulum ATPase